MHTPRVLPTLPSTESLLKQALKRIERLESSVKSLGKQVNELSIEVTDLNQYGRRDSIEVVGLSESILPHELETHVIRLLSKIKVEVTKRDIVAVHRLGKSKRGGSPRNTIVKFLNRKDAYQAYKNRTLLKKINEYKKIFIIENLCPKNRRIFNRLYRLYKNGVIYDVWTHLGHVFATFTEDEEVQIKEEKDIDKYLDDLWGLSSDDDSSNSDATGVDNRNRQSNHIRRLSTTYSSCNDTINEDSTVASNSNASSLNSTIDTSNITTRRPSTALGNDMDNSLVTRVINLNTLKCDLNKWAHEDDNVYIGRPNHVFFDEQINKDAIWGNPHHHDNTESGRIACCKKFKNDLLNDPNNTFLVNNLNELKGKTLGCWCPPGFCHGDIYVELLEKPNGHVPNSKAQINQSISRSPTGESRISISVS